MRCNCNLRFSLATLGLRFLSALSWLMLLGCSNSTVAIDIPEKQMDGIDFEQVLTECNFELPVQIEQVEDGTDRYFVLGQRGLIYLVDGLDDDEAEIFLEIETRYHRRENEEGLLGIAFHPNFRSNKKFYLYYTAPDEPKRSIISEFTVSADDDNRADPDSERIIMELPQPYWNHNGGTLLFGPDGYLYIALGDGGLAHDPHGNGQNTETLLGSILRIDVNKTEGDKNYGIPPENPFAGQPDQGLPEIYAYGLRNVWRMNFDPETGKFWCADVGQDDWEEIDIIVPGGNYGWNFREGAHEFKHAPDREPEEQLIDPIFDYSHEIGRSVTGGRVYRGEKFPKLVGKYIFGDYVTGAVWALEVDHDKEQAVANHVIRSSGPPVASFGSDLSGDEVFLIDRQRITRMISE